MKAKQSVIQVEKVVKTMVNEAAVELTLSVEEASVLMFVCGLIGGPKEGPRKVFDDLLVVLKEQEILPAMAATYGADKSLYIR